MVIVAAASNQAKSGIISSRVYTGGEYLTLYRPVKINDFVIKTKGFN